MAGMDILKDAGRSILGMTEKAIIEFEDERTDSITVQSLDAVGLPGGVNLADMAGNIPMSEAAKKLMDEALALLGLKKRYKVRFNPNQLTLKVEEEGTHNTKQNLAINAPAIADYDHMMPKITLGVDLVFDDMTREDSFMSEKLSGDGLLRTGIDVLRGKTRTVQPPVEGFIAALRNPRTRKVTFNWGTMSYTGVLTGMEAEYTMFSIGGRPVRANVHLDILCVDTKIANNDMGQWKTAYNKAFGMDLGSNLESAAQNVGNLLNFNL